MHSHDNTYSNKPCIITTAVMPIINIDPYLSDTTKSLPNAYLSLSPITDHYKSGKSRTKAVIRSTVNFCGGKLLSGNRVGQPAADSRSGKFDFCSAASLFTSFCRLTYRYVYNYLRKMTT